jgi:hypothetical protein
MDTIFVVIAAAVTFLILELLFMGYAFRWLSAGKKQREKGFARLDEERRELLQLQTALRADTTETKKLADETLKKLRMLGAEAHQEWVEMRSDIEKSIADFQAASHTVMEETVGSITRNKLALEKNLKVAAERERTLTERLREVERVLKILDKSVPVEQILKDIQLEKYSEARDLLNKGMDAPLISKKLGISLNEVALLSHVR